MIFYFTGTGNSRHAAEFLAQRFNDSCVDLAQALRRQHLSYEIAPGACVGFVLPTYYYGIPSIAAEFLQKLRLHFQGAPYVFLVMNCGGSIGAADQMAKAQLGTEIHACFDLKMVENFASSLPVPRQTAIAALLTQADAELDEIAKRVQNREAGDFCKRRGPMSAIKTKLAYPWYQHGRKTRRFRVKKTCIGCGKCAEIAPCARLQCSRGVRSGRRRSACTVMPVCTTARRTPSGWGCFPVLQGAMSTRKGGTYEW